MNNEERTQCSGRVPRNDYGDRRGDEGAQAARLVKTLRILSSQPRKASKSEITQSLTTPHPKKRKLDLIGLATRRCLWGALWRIKYP